MRSGIVCLADDFSTRPREPSFAASHVNHHGAPFILIVDQSSRIVQADRRPGWRDLVASLGPFSGERLPPRLARIVAAHSARSDATPTVAVLADDVVVSVVSFDGTDALRACWLWQVRRENVIDDARRRFLLTKRECELLDRILSGDASTAIAESLSIALATVEWHTKRLLQKTDSQNRTQLAVRVLGWLPDSL